LNGCGIGESECGNLWRRLYTPMIVAATSKKAAGGSFGAIS